MITIDGSHGEGGGQILRTALALSAIRGQPFRMVNIRAARKKPGLQPQHLMAVKSAKTVANAEVSGDASGSMEITFAPRTISGGSFRFDIGTAGSISLVLQTVIPMLLFAHRDSTITVTGGTNVPFSPSGEYLAQVFAPTLKKLGCTIRIHGDHYGFYPRGGGKVRVEVFRTEKLSPLEATVRGAIRHVTGCSGVGNLPDNIAERQKKRAMELLKPLPCPVEVERIRVEAYGPGSFVFLRLEEENGLAGFQALGAPGKPAETVATEAANQLLEHVETGAAMDPHLADQIILYLALCRERSAFTTSAVTRHLLTNLWVMELFGACRYAVEGELGKAGRITIN
ncbi:RNA 3'-phosphate cyclase, class II [Geotalea daltonii FRC-32]|uniref:RNA 3'-terminal phosphate cyclase n=1 Tax=Geotalea daltonii (strain DSM 22248 / JCM 15807 / FRC-32) TaxID=316067 RepID=B9M2E6_GEODF|nr:RNA 3'-terminal phosphate cyclase [Geotalea daltonii]ACM19325.1 RNA 3'-phosphate cyclase, class II [Geotalea daltonii FRC-32]